VKGSSQRRTRLVWGLSLGAVALTALSAAALVYTSRPEFCASCHIMQTRYVSWARSVHAPVTNCLSCHAEPGVVGEIVAHLNGARYLYVQALGGPETVILRGEVADGTCAKCHPPGTLPQVAPNGVRIAHEAHVRVGLRCHDCHVGFHDSLQEGVLESGFERCGECHARPFELALLRRAELRR
jgi:hypothetical protein